ncbi:hypothetical protein BYT27DRAFT_7148536 [Phlegmacium glaucopus]|nr:hypothetical protein BYT27DRAFT_7148536 [Phlegmacium glaucopus]
MGNGSRMTFLRNEPFLTRVHVSATADEAALFIPPHWHELHDEIFRVLKGRLEVRIGNDTRIYVPDDGEVRIPKRVVHSLRFFPGEECIMEEKTEPMDEEKEMFFRNMMGTMGDGVPTKDILQVALIAYHGDLRPAFPWRSPWLEKAFVSIFGGYIAPLFGYKLKYYAKAKRL